MVESKDLDERLSILCGVSAAKHGRFYTDIETGRSSTVSETGSKTFSISKMFEPISLSMLLCGIVVGMTLSKVQAEIAS